MNRSAFRTRRLAVVATAILLPIMLAGCANYDEERRITFATWKQSEPIPRPTLAQTPVHHSVALSNAQVSDVEREALEIFLRRNGIAPGARVTLSAPLPADGDAEALGRRLIAVRKALEGLGIGAATLPAGTGAGSALPTGSVMVTANVLAVVQPQCPGYNTPIQLDNEHRPIIEPGCTQAINLGLMLANPADLQNGQALSPADGEATGPAIQRYRANQVWPDSSPSSAVPFGDDTTATD